MLGVFWGNWKNFEEAADQRVLVVRRVLEGVGGVG